MRVFAGALAIAFSLAVSAIAQQSDPPVSVERMRVALQQPRLVIRDVPPLVSPSATRLGILTFLSPDTNGEMVKVGVPVGELISRTAHAISTARRRRAERKAHEEVLRALEEFEAKQPQR